MRASFITRYFFLEIILLPYNTQDLTVNPPYFQVNQCKLELDQGNNFYLLVISFNVVITHLLDIVQKDIQIMN